MLKKTTNFYKARIMSGLTQEQLAKLSGVAQTTVHTLEKNGCYNTKTAKRYAKAMNVPIIFLLDGLS